VALRKTIHILKKTLLWTIFIIAAFIVLIPVSLYVPAVQEVAKNIACRELSESSGMEISLQRIRLNFPLTLELDNLSVKESGDTLLAARKIYADVAVWPLFSGKINVRNVSLSDADYRLNNADSAVFLTAHIKNFTSTGTNLGFDMKQINVGKTFLDGADIALMLKDTTTVSSTDSTKTDMIISVPDIRLRNIRFHMKMLPTIDSLNTFIGNAQLLDGWLDMALQKIDVGSLNVDSITATYLTPSAEFLKNYKSTTSTADTTLTTQPQSTTPWTINARHIGITGNETVYATAGAQPVSGLDINYIQVNDIKIEIDSFYNQSTNIRVPLTMLHATERCGLNLTASGIFEMDSTAIHAHKFNITTPSTDILLDAMMSLGDISKNPSVPLRLKANGTVALSDIYAAMPSVAKMMKGLPSKEKINLIADIDGTSGALNIGKLSADMPGYISISAKGQVKNPMDFKRMDGQIDINGRIRNADFLKAQILDKQTGPAINIPPMTINGKINYHPGIINGSININSGNGNMALNAKWNQKAEGYDTKLISRNFPIQKFMPGLGVADLTVDAKVKGHGYDPEKRSTRIKADINLGHVSYNGQSLRDITINASIDTCRLTGHVISYNEAADIDVDLTAWFGKQGYEWDLSGDIRNLDLKALGLTKEPMNGTTEIYTSGRFNPRNGDIDAELSLNGFNWIMAEQRLNVPEATAKFITNDTLTNASVDMGDFKAIVTSPCGLDTLMRHSDATFTFITNVIKTKNLDVIELQRTLPQLHADISIGNRNPISNYLATYSGLEFKDAKLEFDNDTLISMHGEVNGFQSGTTRLDKIGLNLSQKKKFLVYRINVDNEPGTMDDFAHVNLAGYISADKLLTHIKQSNIKGKQGFVLGLSAHMSDSTLTLKFVPFNPTIAYKNWQINHDNSVVYSFDSHHLDANLKLMSDSSSLHLYTEHIAEDSVHQEDVILKLNNIKLSEWLSLSPFAPPVKGVINANLRFRWDDKQLTGKGTVDVNNLYYGRERVGTFGLGLDVANDPKSGLLRANADLFVDGVKVITASGNLNDSTAVNPFLLDFSMIHFPLRVVNPFLPKDMAQFSGMLNGRMDITGDLANPIFNGYLDFDSTAVKVGIMGSSYAFSEEKIPVDSNVVRFTNFSIAGLNGKDLKINGTVDASHLSNIGIDLSMTARDMQIVNSARPRGANIYGKAFIDLDATAKGNMQFLKIDADLNILAGTNVTYVIQDAASKLTSQSNNEMVRFVQFSDTAQVTHADSLVTPSMAMSIDARLTISEGSTINADLSPDGKNKVSLQANGNLTYSQTPMSSEGRLTGRLNINKGFVRYTPPLMSEKNFSFQEGCYVAFTGNILNPTLNIKAVDRLKANVTQPGANSRIINFDVLLSVTNTLENMNAAFDLSTDEDITIQNELASMSPEQRANQAMNMLLYNTYTGPGAKASTNLSGNPLYSFLASQINTWAANNIRGVDISFGIDQYDKTTDGAKSTTTSYSYRVSKSLFNDRFKIVVGGNYSTDADADENFSQNLINDISFEYMLNRSGSMYVRLFRHVGYESILEGEITQTGVGFVMKRKINSFRDIFRFSPRNKEKESKAQPDQPNIGQK